MGKSYSRPFDGIRVVDLSQGLAGPACAMLLAAHGAEVVKVEPPEGDWVRALGTRHGEQSGHAMAVNRGKRSIALDLKAPEGLEVAWRLIARADVVIESFRPGGAARLGLDYEAVRARNARALYVSISGFGRTGPYAARAATDMVGQAHSGMMSLTRDGDGRPQKIGFVLVDSVCALFAFQAVATSLYARESEGRLIDVSLMQSAAALIAPKIVESHLEGASARPLNVPGGSYRTRDGWIAITMMRESQYQALCRALGRPELAEDARFAGPEARADAADVLVPLIQEVVATRTTEDWLARLSAAGVLCNRINAVGDWLADEHVRAVEAAPMLAQAPVGAVPVPRIPGLPEAALANLAPEAPAIGAHAAEILAELGYSDAEAAALRAKGVVRAPAATGTRAAGGA
jgi:crotonobetainyl-CoA:carnitine CoA-transferase CaiB-like acyl-CoA transferase